MLDRRAFLLGMTPALACRRAAEGFRGYAFVANREGRSLAAVDLNTFRVRKEITVDGSPAAVLSDAQRPAIYVLTPENGTVHEIDPVSLSVRRKTRAVSSAISMRSSPDGGSLWVLSRESPMLAHVSTATLQPGGRVRLPAAPADFDLAGAHAAVSFPDNGSFAVVELRTGKLSRAVAAGPGAGTIRFHDNGRQLWCGNRGNRTMTKFDMEQGRIVAHLPVAVEPKNFCFKADGGVLYVTGPGMDAIVEIQPFQTEVYETRLVGRSPGAMALSGSPEYLFVANAGAGNVTVMDINTSKILTAVTVGAEPRFILVTPGNQYALTLNNRSGDMAVILIEAITNTNRPKTAPSPLFTMIPVGAGPVSAVIRPA